MSRERKANGGSMIERGISRKNFLRAGGIGVAGAALFGAAACGGEEQGSQTGAGSKGLVSRSDIRIVMVTHGSASDPFWSVVKNGADQAAKDLGVEFEYRSPESFDVVEIQQNLDAAIASQPDGIAMSIVDQAALADSAQKAVDEGIPVIVLNAGREAWEQVGALSYIGQTEFEAGVEAGKRMAEEGVKRAFCVNQEQGNSSLAERCNGFAKGLGGDVQELAVQGTDPTSARNAILTSLRNNPDVDGMLTLGPQGALPALQALKSFDRSDEIAFATFDLATEVLKALSEKKMLFAIDQQQFLQGYLPVTFLTTNVQYGLVPVGEVRTGPAFVTPENADDVIELTKQGIR